MSGGLDEKLYRSGAARSEYCDDGLVGGDARCVAGPQEAGVGADG